MGADWYQTAHGIDALADAELDARLVRRLQASVDKVSPIRFYLPSFKAFESDELTTFPGVSWPAISITGRDCRLQCDHCGGRLLESMRAARTPEALWEEAERAIAAGAGGMLLTGGSTLNNEIDYGAFLPILDRIKGHYPGFSIAVHTGLMGPAEAKALRACGVDVAMMDIIGAQDTVSRVYHLKRPVSDFERTLAALVESGLRVVPHIVLGLHYGRLLGEWEALEMIARHRTESAVLVAVMPHFARPDRPFATPDAEQVGQFFADARSVLPDRSLVLGCARPPGMAKVRMDAYAVMAGLDGVTHPSDGTVELARRLGRAPEASAGCCSVEKPVPLVAKSAAAELWQSAADCDALCGGGCS
jgi:uncharacterized radical SAM superfamily protein